MSEQTKGTLQLPAGNPTATNILSVGGAGSNIARSLLNNLPAASYPQFRLAALNTDARLQEFYFGSKEGPKGNDWGERFVHHQLGGNEVTKGLGAGTDPEMGKRAAQDPASQKFIREFIEGGSNNIVVTGLGGGTGSGASVVIAELCKSTDKPTVAIAITPDPEEEGKKRLKKAMEALDELRAQVPTITINNAYLTEYVSKHLKKGKTAQTVKSKEAWAFVDSHAILPLISFTNELLQVPGDVVSTDQANWKNWLKLGKYVFIGWIDFTDPENPRDVNEMTEEDILKEITIGHFQDRAVLLNGKSAIFLTHGPVPWLKRRAVKVALGKIICGTDQAREENFEMIEGNVEEVSDGKMWLAIAVIAESVTNAQTTTSASSGSRPALPPELQETRHRVTTRHITYTVDGNSKSKEVPAHLAKSFNEFNNKPNGTRDEMEAIYDEVSRYVGEEIDTPQRFLPPVTEAAAEGGRRIPFLKTNRSN